jgi:hypothetical protein
LIRSKTKRFQVVSVLRIAFLPFPSRLQRLATALVPVIKTSNAFSFASRNSRFTQEMGE